MSFKISNSNISSCDICKKDQEDIPFVISNDRSFIDHKTYICSKKCFLKFNQVKAVIHEIFDKKEVKEKLK